MNTPRSPRETLLARHDAARPALDAQSDTLLARFAAQPAKTEPVASRPAPRSLPSPRDCFAVLWRELVAPYRQAWTALACVWMAIFAFQQLGRLDSPQLFPTPTTHADPALLALWLEQRRLLAEFGTQPADIQKDSPRIPAGTPSTPKSSPGPSPRPLGTFFPVSPDTHVA